RLTRTDPPAQSPNKARSRECEIRCSGAQAPTVIVRNAPPSASSKGPRTTEFSSTVSSSSLPRRNGWPTACPIASATAPAIAAGGTSGAHHGRGSFRGPVLAAGAGSVFEWIRRARALKPEWLGLPRVERGGKCRDGDGD